MSRRSEYSLRGRLEEALKKVENMVARGSRTAHFATFAKRPVADLTDDQLNDWIKDRISLYVESWVLPPLREALAKVKK